MLAILQSELRSAAGELEVTFSLRGGAPGLEGVLIAADDVGVCIKGSDGPAFYPWTSIGRIRKTHTE